MKKYRKIILLSFVLTLSIACHFSLKYLDSGIKMNADSSLDAVKFEQEEENSNLLPDVKFVHLILKAAKNL